MTDGRPLRYAAPKETWPLFGIRLKVVDARDAVEHIETQIGLVAQIDTDFHQAGRQDLDPRVDRFEIDGGDLVVKSLFQAFNEILACHRVSRKNKKRDH